MKIAVNKLTEVMDNLNISDSDSIPSESFDDDDDYVLSIGTTIMAPPSGRHTHTVIVHHGPGTSAGILESTKQTTNGIEEKTKLVSTGTIILGCIIQDWAAADSILLGFSVATGGLIKLSSRFSFRKNIERIILQASQLDVSQKM
ncbi:uncharacterized protein Bfra_004956 [Botrytis fragariae]|uniref:Uncharacterized protein n=1 Tax=Botrytis fragariae TaxID=1964551 RepID=A0A8H6EIU8_9HELO|nr:uncharacterized protein Bfra_004956 [Botrytis fragariae]KAF5873495.1 hypothetical protein Bfra_004956 [Botrytis fragariae]